MVMRRNVSLTPLPLSKGRGECMLLLGVSIFMWWLLGDMLLPLSKGRGECILLLGVSVFMWLLGVSLFVQDVVFYVVDDRL